MKKLLFSIIAIFLTLTLFSCKQNNEDSEDSYYVKYQISGNLYFYIDGVSYYTEKGSHSEKFPAIGSFEVICGPVNKNFVARISLTQYRGTPTSNAAKISISKNNGPFAMKASGQYSATYTIDF